MSSHPREHQSKPSLPFSLQMAYAVGQLGWSLVMGIIANYLIYFYMPPREAGLPQVIPDIAIFGFISIIGLITMGGRLLDAITDPWIATLSDASPSPKGRRISFMAKGGLPMVISMILVFSPPKALSGNATILYLAIVLCAYYIFYTVYVTPYFALIPELGHTPKERLNLSTYISFTFFLGTAISSQAPLFFSIFANLGLQRVSAVRLTFALMGLLALICLYMPVIFINEREYSSSKPSSASVLESLRLTFKNPNFLPFALSDLIYFLSLTILQSGLLYYVTVLLHQPEPFYSTLFITMAIGSFFFYPLVNLLGGKIGKKFLVQLAFIIFSLTFLSTAFLGLSWVPLSPVFQGFLVAALAFFPLAAFGILPNAIVADIAEHDALRTGSHREAIYYGARTFMQKLGQMLAMLIFTSLLLLGRDVGQDLGIRLTGPVAFVFCIIGLLLFSLYNEKRVLLESAKMKEETDHSTLSKKTDPL